ncbi:VWA domain-containing protein [Flavobacteriaceae bacterium SZ-1-7]|uniref:VWA domain-containing protein n=1 Tax=Tamlana sedimenti TaxID=3134126 RepID=UPI003123DE16
MQTETLLYIILAGIIALLLSFFQYFNKKKSMSQLNMLFAFLRFITIFSVLLLIINPSFNKVTLSTEKPNLILAIDNSSSIKHLNQKDKALNFIESISKNEDLKNKFNLELYTFGESISASDSIDFSENQTNIYNAFTQLGKIYKQTTSPTLLLTDGNQTYGNDYQFVDNTYGQPIFPIIMGDTTKYTDLKIQQLNVNKYAYLKNKFPVEAILVYNGDESVNSNLVVTRGNSIVYSENLNFSKTNNSRILNFNLPANSVGVGQYKITLTPLGQEKNKINNEQNFAVEVINQKTKIAIVSDFLHPDLGVLKKSIESNEQRTISFIGLNDVIDKINDFQLIILYQPNNKFKLLVEKLNVQKKNQFIIIGPKTDLDFLNEAYPFLNQQITNQTEDYQAELNRNYAPFLIQDLDFESFPPLLSNYGTVQFSVPFETILNKTFKGVSVGEPLLATFEINSWRQAVLFGENIWQWRAQSFINEKSFKPFDDFIGKLIQYLATNQQKSRLNIEYESFYKGNNNVIVKAEFFDKNYVFDARESLEITVVDNNSNETKTFPLVLKNNYYQVDLSGLPPETYNFVVRAKNDNLSKSGSFQILEYNVEQQFLNADVTKLQKLATNSQGKSYFIDDWQNLIKNLLDDKRFVPIQKSVKKTIPLVDWKYLLAIIALSLGLEWLIRKYNGLI